MKGDFLPHLRAKPPREFEGRKPLIISLPPPFAKEGDTGGGFKNLINSPSPNRLIFEGAEYPCLERGTKRVRPLKTSKALRVRP
jgi:hypothetical protein